MESDPHTRSRASWRRFQIPAPTVSLAGVSPTMAGGLIVATLAYPEVEFAETRVLTAYRLAGRTTVNLDVTAGEWFGLAAAPQIFLPFDRRKLAAGMLSLERRLRRRLDVGHVALQPLVAADRGERPRHVRGDHWNRTAAIQELCNQRGIPEPKNFEHRWWDTSLAVMHIAAAWAGMLLRAAIDGGPREQVQRVLTDEAYLHELVSRSQAMEMLIERSELEIPPSALLKFRLGDQGQFQNVKVRPTPE